MEKDFVCGMEIDEKESGSSDTFNYKGKTYRFCSEECRDEFKKSPEKFLK